MKKTILMGLVIAVILATSGITISTPTLAQKNGWGDATSEEARESGKDFGAHASGQDDDTNGPGDPPFNGDGKPGRSGIGNVGDDPNDDPPGIHPDDLGKLLDCVDQDDPDDPSQC